MVVADMIHLTLQLSEHLQEGTAIIIDEMDRQRLYVPVSTLSNALQTSHQLLMSLQDAATLSRMMDVSAFLMATVEHFKTADIANQLWEHSEALPEGRHHENDAGVRSFYLFDKEIVTMVFPLVLSKKQGPTTDESSLTHLHLHIMASIGEASSYPLVLNKIHAPSNLVIACPDGSNLVHITNQKNDNPEADPTTSQERHIGFGVFITTKDGTISLGALENV